MCEVDIMLKLDVWLHWLWVVIIHFLGTCWCRLTKICSHIITCYFQPQTLSTQLTLYIFQWSNIIKFHCLWWHNVILGKETHACNVYVYRSETSFMLPVCCVFLCALKNSTITLHKFMYLNADYNAHRYWPEKTLLCYTEAVSKQYTEKYRQQKQALNHLNHHNTQLNHASPFIRRCK